MSEIQEYFDEYNAPRPMAQAMLKRFHQFKRALPGSDYKEVFQMILDNRYKLLGNIISATEKAENITKAYNSISLLTFNTMISENQRLLNHLKSDSKDLDRVISEILDEVNQQFEEEKSLEELTALARKNM